MATDVQSNSRERRIPSAFRMSWRYIKLKGLDSFKVGIALWEKLSTLGQIIAGGLTAFAALTSLVLFLLKTDTATDCLAEQLTLTQLQNCIFSEASAPMKNAFIAQQKGRRLFFKTKWGQDFSSAESGNYLFYTLNYWGPNSDRLGSRGVITCERPFIEKREAQQISLLKSLRPDEEILATGVVKEISQSNLSLEDCLVFRPL